MTFYSTREFHHTRMENMQEMINDFLKSKGVKTFELIDIKFSITSHFYYALVIFKESI